MLLNAEMVTLALEMYEEYKGEAAEEATMNILTYRQVQKQGIEVGVPIVVDYKFPNHMIYIGKKGQFSGES